MCAVLVSLDEATWTCGGLTLSGRDEEYDGLYCGLEDDSSRMTALGDNPGMTTSPG